MTRRTAAGRGEGEVVRLCHAGLDPVSLPTRILPALRRVLSVDAAFFAGADPTTLLFTGAHAEAPLADVQGLFLANEFGTADVNKFASLATAREHVASLDSATHGDRSASPRYREVMAPLGLGDELRAALVVDSHCWGYLCLHREDSPRGFSAAEAAVVTRLGPHIAYALRQSVLLDPPAPSGATVAPGVLLLTDDLDVVAATPEAEYLLAEIDDERAPARSLPVAVHAAAAALLALERGGGVEARLPSTRARTITGDWLDVSASRMTAQPGSHPADAGPLAVVLRPADEQAAVPLVLAAHGLTPRESAVARLVLRGTPTTGIANSLHISRHTVQDHLKRVFDKVGVNSRRDLVARLLSSPGRADGTVSGGRPPPRVSRTGYDAGETAS